MVIIMESNFDDFEAVATKEFSFLESKFGFKYFGLKVVREDPRDSYVAVRYRGDLFHLDIVWNPLAMFLGVFVRLNGCDLERSKKYLYFEPFVEYMTGGSTKPIISQIYPGMSVGKIERAMEERNNLFKDGVSQVVTVLSEKVRVSFELINSANKADVEKYHEWYANRGRAT